MAIYFLVGPIILLSGGQAYQEINCLWPKLSKNRLLWVKFDAVTPKKLPLLERFP